nr:uncharacterized protein K02A2.6-like [Rhipicephalus microplus]
MSHRLPEFNDDTDKWQAYLVKKLQEQSAAVLHVAAPPLGASPESPPAPAVLDPYSDLCTEGVGLMKGPAVRLHIKPGVTPKFFKELQGDEDAAEYVLVVDHWNEPAVPMKELQALTQSDGVLSSVCRYVIQVVSDNGTPFTGWEFKELLQQNGVVHVWAPPYHPQSNGLAERAVRTIKDGLKKCGDADLSRALARTLCRYRNTPLPSGCSPSEMLLGYQLRTRLDMCFPPRSRATGDVHSADSAEWNFALGDTVYLRNYGRGDKWTPGKVRSTSGARILSVDTENGLVHQHLDQLRRID